MQVTHVLSANSVWTHAILNIFTTVLQQISLLFTRQTFCQWMFSKELKHNSHAVPDVLGLRPSVSHLDTINMNVSYFQSTDQQPS